MSSCILAKVARVLALAFFPLLIPGVLFAADDEATLAMAREPLSQDEIQALAETDDILAIEILAGAVTRRLGIRQKLGPIVPLHLDAELIEALRGLDRLDGDIAERLAREVLRQVPPECLLASEARSILARRGDFTVIREALSHFFEDRDRWGKILEKVAWATGDPRLRDFLGTTAPWEPASPHPKLLQTDVERFLTDSRDPWKLGDLLFWAEENPSLSAARLLSHFPEGTIHEGWVTHLLAAYLTSPKAFSLENSPSLWARYRALAALGRRKAGSGASLMPALESEDPITAVISALCLGNLEHLPATAALRAMSLATDEMKASAAIEALVAMRGKDEALRLSGDVRLWSFRSALAVVEALDVEAESERVAARRVVVGIVDSKDRLRVLRSLAQTDSSLLTTLTIRDHEISDLYGYFARSSHLGLRESILSAEGDARGPALAALVVSPQATQDEKTRALEILRDAWPEAVLAGGAAVVEELEPIWQQELDSSLSLDVLAVLPGAGARRLIEEVGTAEAIGYLMNREDRLLALPALGRLKRQGDQRTRDAAETALLMLGAPGSSAIMRRRLSEPETLRGVMSALARAPLANEAFGRLSGSAGRRPDVQAALYAYFEKRPPELTYKLEPRETNARHRVLSAMALTDPPSRLPVLIDAAINEAHLETRLAVLSGLAEGRLGRFAARLHKITGDPDRRIRFASAVALTPNGEEWALRLLLSEMDSSRRQERQLARRAIDRLPGDDAQSRLEALFMDGTAGPYAIDLFFDRAEAVTGAYEERAWELVQSRLDDDPFALRVAARLDDRNAAHAVLVRLR